MEIGTPSYSLADILAQMQSVPDMNLTVSARAGIRDAGMGQADALSVVQSLTRKHFYKGMTSHADHRVWQDVYHGQWGDVALYIKFQRSGEGCDSK
ncbi:MAG: type II toxin-antitoxin system MqsR family toxin [Rhodoferax sp.]|nr:type II toxin-antitoxin system MqsR family toxin [Rhodoferax sp.]